MAPRAKPEAEQPDRNPSPKLLEVNASVALNGNIQVKKFDIKSGYHFGISERYDVSQLSQTEAEEFEEARLIELYDKIDPIAQAEFEKLWDQRLETGE